MQNESGEREFQGGCEDGCPPESSQDCDGLVYRVIARNNPHRKDFRSYMESNPNKWRAEPNKFTRCMACGLSVYKEIGDARAYMGESALLKKNAKIAAKKLTYEDGKILATPSKKYKSHHTWWFCSDDPQAGFDVVSDK